MCQRTMNSKVAGQIEREYQAQGPEIMALRLQDMYMELRFSHDAARLLVREQRLYSPEWHKILTDKNVDDLCNVVRKSGGKNANWMPDRGPKVSIITKLIGKLWECKKTQCIC